MQSDAANDVEGDPQTRDATTPLVVAHRAGNSLATLAEAEEAGADLIEADIWRFRGRVEVRHLKTLGPVPVLWDRWKLASGRGPRLGLEALVAAASGRSELMLDLKGGDPKLPGQVIETMDRVAPGRRYTVSSQWWKQLAPFAPLEHVRVVHSIGNLRMFRALQRQLGDDGAEALGINHTLLTPERAETLRDLAPALFSWTVNHPERVETLLEWGVTGIIADDYHVVLQALGR